MATFALDDAFVSIDGNDLSDQVRNISFDFNRDEVEDTNMGDDTHLMLPGLKNWTVTVEFSQDFAAGQLDALMWPIIDADAAVTIIVRPTSSSVSATNPNYTGSVVLTQYNPVQGSVGDLATTSITFRAAGSLSRATS